MSDELKLMPIQKSHLLPRDHAEVRESVYLRAYEVYSYVHSPQPALIVGDCRGGFGLEELVAFLYAGNFPMQEWRARVDEALTGARL